jgi:Icc-related predicted phosphoesterase
MIKLRLIGDIHGNVTKLLEFTKDYDNYDLAIQLGDFGFLKAYAELINAEISSKVRFFEGNHDHIEFLVNSPPLGNKLPLDGTNIRKHYLGRYGRLTLMDDDGFKKVYWVGGGFSINRKFLTPGLNWFPEEEIPISEHPKILEDYLKYKPDVMLSHEAPREIANLISSPATLKNYGFNPETFTTNTSELLQDMYNAWQPKTWFFGHFHMNVVVPKEKTVFQCVDSLHYVDVIL